MSDTVEVTETTTSAATSTGAAPSLTHLVEQRHSARAFTSEPVPDAVIDQVLATAQRSPSWCNTQPWRVRLLSGESRDAFSAALMDRVVVDAPQADLGLPVCTGVHAERRRESGWALYEALGIAREDKDARLFQTLKNFTFFGAPHVLVLTAPADLGAYGVLDCGGWLAIVQLLLAEAGLGSIAQGAIGQYSPCVRDFFGLDDDEQVVCALSFGYEDTSDVVNAFRTSRVPLAEVVESQAWQGPGGQH